MLVKMAAEFCARKLGATASAPDNFRQPLWIYWLPASGFGVGLVVWNWTRHWRHRSAVRSVRWLRITAGAAMALAMLVSVAHLALPLFPARPVILNLARQWCVRPELRADFDWLCQQPGANRCRIGDLLEHLNLASLQRGQFAASLPENEWREFVLSPWITGAGEDIAGRRETDAGLAAQMVARELSKRVLLQDQISQNNVLAVWKAGAARAEVFQQIEVAALRAVGVPARMGKTGECEFMAGDAWRKMRGPLE